VNSQTVTSFSYLCGVQIDEEASHVVQVPWEWGSKRGRVVEETCSLDSFAPERVSIIWRSRGVIHSVTGPRNPTTEGVEGILAGNRPWFVS